MDAYKCQSCGSFVTDQESHVCSRQKYQKISLTPAEYCAKFEHSYGAESEVSGTKRRYGRVETVWENEEKYVEKEGWQVIKICTVCGYSESSWKEHWL